MSLVKHCPRRRSITLLASALTASLLLLAVSMRAPAHADDEKKPLTHHDYHQWRTIQSPTVSPDGRFVAYVLSPAEGETQVLVQDLFNASKFQYVIAKSAGAGAAKGAAKGGKGPAAGPEGIPATRIAFSADSKRLVFSIGAPKADPAQKEPAKETKEPAEPARASLGVMELKNGNVTVIPGVRNFILAEEGGLDLIAYHKFPAAAAKKEGDAPAKGREGEGKGESEEEPYGGGDQKKGGKGAGGGQKGGPGAAKGGPAMIGDLVLRNLGSGGELVIPDVADYTLTRGGQWLICSVAPKDGDHGVFAYSTPNGKLVKVPVALGKAKYTRFTWDEHQRFFAFFADRGEGKDPGAVSLTMWDRENPFGPAGTDAGAVELLNSKNTSGMQPGMALAERGPLSISEDGSKVFFAVGPPQAAQDKEATTEEPAAAKGQKGGKGGDEKVNVELWHWKDDFIQPMQKVRAGQEKGRTYSAVMHVREHKVVQLGGKGMATVTPSREGSFALGSDDTPYRPLVAYDGNYNDYYLVSTADGSRKPLLQKHHWGVTFSPSGRFAIYFDGRDWNTIAIPSGNTVNITSKINTKFAMEDFDSPSAAPSYGIVGWSSDDYYVIVNDKYDLWEVSVRGSGFRNLTQGLGRKAKLEFRYVKLDPKEKTIDMSKPMLLKTESHETRDTGFALVDPKSNRAPLTTQLVRGLIGFPIKAKNAETLVYTKQSFYDYPDLYASRDMQFKEMIRVSDANPEKSKFNWGRAEMLQYKSADGQPLHGILIKPENFDPAKKYPMIVYIYEKLSQNLHHFVMPKEGTSINPTYYASNGYLVLMPDIVYNVGYPGQSALKCVLPAIQAVADRGFLNEDAIGIQGHSWGGYQIAYMVTQTGRFKAAAAGAPVSNMTSAYDGIRWGTGLPRQFQYEKTQSRIGGSLWEYPMRFVENSPVFMADRVKTPLMILHNDQDDAVPWYQGIEYYLALRRLGKEVYMFNYPGEKHGLTKKANQMDYTVRMQQFFDHYLRGGSRPEWMERGIPYTPPVGQKGPAIMTNDKQ
jgi:dienelactone hydrolase